jgi:dolichol kinase
MKKKYVILSALCILFAIALLNFTFIRFFLPQTYPHTYCSDKCRFRTIEQAKGRGDIPLKRVEFGFQQYKIQTNQPNLILYRRFYRKWWQVWNWYDFFTSPCWSYPYAEKDEST